VTVVEPVATVLADFDREALIISTIFRTSIGSW
jgi:hypothetical protein